MCLGLADGVLQWVLVLPFLTMVVILLFGRDITNTLPL